ncbi:hypothetical protein [Dyadobacter frigoris]|uniref:Uncharacterized protein n=1 Tax=Dyadobacter frigoris TaxID=2576211 RepID=A0A4U6D7K6_9BACT|nr:hypothetical protein [Dyadobacter frigoris]TKT93382.1 hypothetical protein FDK13_05895 [Dyadobacter frigoris]GLU54695.1 hypothetical protein Dfri01_41560 [Dyadobacter frigoris]
MAGLLELRFRGKGVLPIDVDIGTSFQAYPINWGQSESPQSFLPLSMTSCPTSASGDFVAECKYYAYWSAVHGPISLIFLNRGGSDDANMHVLPDTIHCVTTSEVY